MPTYWQLEETTDRWQLEENTDRWELEESLSNVTGTGAFLCQSASIGSSGITSSSGAGVFLVVSSTCSGAAISSSIGTGTVLVGACSMSGVGTVGGGATPFLRNPVTFEMYPECIQFKEW